MDRTDGDALPGPAGPQERAGLMSDAGSAVESADPTASVVGELTYVRGLSAGVRGAVRVIGPVRVVSRRSGRFVWLSGRSLDPELGLVEQTARLMEVLADTLAGEGMDFGSVVKSTSHYVGGSTPEELYANMMIRNGYCRRPGPASTGLPVHRPAIGLIELTMETAMSGEMHRFLAGTSAGIYTSRVPFSGTTTGAELSKMGDRVVAAADLLPEAEWLDCIVYGCTSRSAFIGHDRLTALIGPIGASAVVVRSRHLATVFGFRP